MKHTLALILLLCLIAHSAGAEESGSANQCDNVSNRYYDVSWSRSLKKRWGTPSEGLEKLEKKMVGDKLSRGWSGHAYTIGKLSDYFASRGELSNLNKLDDLLTRLLAKDVVENVVLDKSTIFSALVRRHELGLRHKLNQWFLTLDKSFLAQGEQHFDAQLAEIAGLATNPLYSSYFQREFSRTKWVAEKSADGTDLVDAEGNVREVRVEEAYRRDPEQTGKQIIRRFSIGIGGKFVSIAWQFLDRPEGSVETTMRDEFKLNLQDEEVSTEKILYNPLAFAQSFTSSENEAVGKRRLAEIEYLHLIDMIGITFWQRLAVGLEFDAGRRAAKQSSWQYIANRLGTCEAVVAESQIRARQLQVQILKAMTVSASSACSQLRQGIENELKSAEVAALKRTLPKSFYQIDLQYQVLCRSCGEYPR